jgi:hypothetical protein
VLLGPDPDLLTMTLLVPCAFCLPGCQISNTLIDIQALPNAVVRTKTDFTPLLGA